MNDYHRDPIEDTEMVEMQKDRAERVRLSVFAHAHPQLLSFFVGKPEASWGKDDKVYITTPWSQNYEEQTVVGVRWKERRRSSQSGWEFHIMPVDDWYDGECLGDDPLLDTGEENSE